MTELQDMQKGRRVYSLVMAITVAALASQRPLLMSIGLGVNVAIWWLVVWEAQRDISRQKRDQGKT